LTLIEATGSTTVTEETTGFAQLITTVREPWPTVPAPAAKPVTTTDTDPPATGEAFVIVRSTFPLASEYVVEAVV